MNITHAVDEEVTGDNLVAIFTRQKELMDKYHDIEARSGLLQTPDCPVNLDDKRGQARIKDFSWRVTEELGEALDAFDDDAHFAEELVDGLHFLTEMSILSDIYPKKIVEYASKVYEIEIAEDVPDDTLKQLEFISETVFEGLPFDTRIRRFIMNIGMTCNCLKNKPWKQSNMITDKEMFYKNLSKTWVSYLSIMLSVMDVEGIVNTYLKKSQVNKFRQRSNY